MLVEPVPHNLRLLKENLKNYDTITIEPITIGQENKITKFYFVKEQSVSNLKKHWASGIGSFDKKHILDHKTKRFKVSDEDIESLDIQCLTFEELTEQIFNITY